MGSTGWRTMTPRDPTWVAGVGTALTVVAVASMMLRGRPPEVLYARWLFHNAPTALALLWLGWALVRRRPGHRLGPLFLIAGVASALHVGMICLADARLVAAGVGEAAAVSFAPADLPLDASVPFWFSTWLWVIPAGSVGTLFLLLFPDGQLPSQRWRWLPPVIGLGIALPVVGFMIAMWPTSTTVMSLDERFPADAPNAQLLALTGLLLLAVATAAAVVSLVSRWRHAPADQRQQLRPVAITGSAAAIGIIVLWPWPAVWGPAVMVLIFTFLATYTVAVLRYRLHDLDLAINRTVVASLLAAAATFVYLAVVVGLGSVVGRTADHPLVPLVAVGIIALAFEPARRAVRQFVDRLLYGRDADAYEVLSELAAQLRDEGSTDVVSSRVTELLVRGTGARGAEIAMVTGEGRQRLAASGQLDGHGPVATAAIVHQGQTLGEVALHARGDADLAPDAQTLLDDVAATLGAVLRNAALTAQLSVQVDELRRSRQRLVTAQEEARRTLERDLHDGAQARLVALRLRLGMAAAQADRAGPGERDRLGRELEALGDDVDAAIRGLRDLARGLRPPVLDSHGIGAALRAGVRGLPLRVLVDEAELGRYPAPLEAAVYFSCLEAVKNAATHGAATQVHVALREVGGQLEFTVEDDGAGFDATTEGGGAGLGNLADRLRGLDGELHVDSAPGRGTRIVGRLPVQPLVSDR